MFHSLYLSANAGRSTTERRPACGRVSSHLRSYLVPRSMTSKESVVFLLRLRCNRLLRRQHCSSLCLQSEGHEHVANMASALGHDFVGFLAVFGRHNMRSPHFASKVSYSASPQTFAECSRSASLPTLIFLNFEHPLIPKKTVSFPLGRIQKAPRRSLMKQGMPRGLSFSCHLPLPLYWRGERSRDTIMCCYGLRALPPTRSSAVFLRFIRTSPFRGCGRRACHLGP